MKNELSLSSGVHPMVVFWLGLLTGAIVVGLVFFYRVLQPVDYESAILRLNRNQIVPQVNTVQPSTNLKAFPSPGGNLNAFPSPGGNLNAFPSPGGN